MPSAEEIQEMLDDEIRRHTDALNNLKKANDRLIAITKAAEPFISMYKINHPWHKSNDQEPLCTYTPGVWPTWGEFKRFIRAIIGEKDV